MSSKSIIICSSIVLVALGIAGFSCARCLYVPGSKPWLPVSFLRAPASLYPHVAGKGGIETDSVQRITPDKGRFKKLGEFTHHYSRRQAWNTEETLILSVEGHIYTSTGEFVTSNSSMTSEVVWSNVNPEIVYAIQQLDGLANRLVSWNVVTESIVELLRFDAMSELTIGQWEGTVSNDDGIVVLYGKENGVPTIVSVDLLSKKVLGKIAAKENFNWAGVSQKGKWILVENSKKQDPNAQLLRYKLDLSNETVLLEKPNHGDFCIDSHGEEVYAMVGKSVSWVELDSGDTYRHKLPPKLYGHISCRALDRPGWAYLSLLNSPGLIGAIPLIADFEKWEPWGSHFSSYETYQVQPKASVSRSGTAVIFTSDMGGTQAPGSYEYRLDKSKLMELSWKADDLQLK